MTHTITVKQLSAIFDRVSDGTVKAYWIMHNGKKYAFCYDREQAQSIADALPGETEIIEREVL